MKAILQEIYLKYSYDKVLHWIKLITITGGSQIIVQVASILAGFLIIRLLPMQEYAYYTIANTALGTMTVLSDGGISSGVMAQGGKAWQDKTKLGVVLATGLALRKRFAAVSLLVSIPILLYLLLHQGAGWLTSMLIVLSLIPAFLAALSDSMLEIVPKLHQDMKPLQINQLLVSIGRLLLGYLLLMIYPMTFVALIANGLPRIYGNIKLKSIASKFVVFTKESDGQEREQILTITKKILPVALYYSLSSQITICLLSLLGNSANVAQMGALSRLTMAVTFLSIFFSNLSIPRFARIDAEKKGYIVRFFLVNQFILISVGCCIVFFVWLFDVELLLILGKAYVNLSRELVLSTLAACIALLTNISGNLLATRGWIMNPLPVVVINISVLLISLWFFDLTSLIGTIYYNIFLSSVVYLFCISYAVAKVRSL